MLHTLRWHNWHTYQAQFFTFGWHIYVIFLFFLPKIPCLHRQTASLIIFLQMKNAVARSWWKASTVLEASGSGNRLLPPCSWGRGWCTFVSFFVVGKKIILKAPKNPYNLPLGMFTLEADFEESREHSSPFLLPQLVRHSHSSSYRQHRRGNNLWHHKHYPQSLSKSIIISSF